MKTMTFEEAKELCDERIRFCANLYGAKFVTELPFLKACSEALEIAINAPENFTDSEANLVSDVFQNYYMEGLYDIANENETAKSIFEKLGLIEKHDEIVGEDEEANDNET